MVKKIAVLPGDGIGPEIVDEGVKILRVVAETFGYRFSFRFGMVGGGAIDRVGNPLPQETLD
ncbi:MAG: isocitrate/isopropylmalate family dehydrogenase, partial [Planifilum fulgidum]